MSTAHRIGLDVAWFEKADGLPFENRGAAMLPDQLQIDPVEYVDALRTEAERHGAVVLEGVRATKVRGTSPVTVETANGSVRAGTVVVSTNLPFLDRGGFFARAEPARSYALAYSVPGPVVDGMYLAADSPSVSLRDAPGPLLLVGGNGHRPGAPVSERQHLDELRQWTAQHWQGPCRPCRHTHRRLPGRRHRAPSLRGVHAPRRRGPVERRRALLGLPAARLPLRRRRLGARGSGDVRPGPSGMTAGGGRAANDPPPHAPA